MRNRRFGEALEELDRVPREKLQQNLSSLLDKASTDGSQSTCFMLELDKTTSEIRVLTGILRIGDSLIVEADNKGRLITVDVKKKKLLSVSGIDLSGVKHGQFVDLNVDGDRWEGDVLNGIPCGWGVLYDKDNDRLYEGFRVGRMSVCYGKKYYSDISVVEYEGGICEEKRWGEGTQYDRNGEVLIRGEWVNGEHLDTRVVITEERVQLHSQIEELVVKDNCCNEEEWSMLDLGLIRSLRLLRVGDECFRYVNELKFIGMKKLESVVIGKNSFTKKKNIFGNDSGGRFYLKDCPKLKELKMGRYSFSDYTLCEIENCALEVMEIGEVGEESKNFYYTSLELKSMSVVKE